MTTTTPSARARRTPEPAARLASTRLGRGALGLTAAALAAAATLGSASPTGAVQPVAPTTAGAAVELVDVASAPDASGVAAPSTVSPSVAEPVEEPATAAVAPSAPTAPAPTAETAPAPEPAVEVGPTTSTTPLEAGPAEEQTTADSAAPEPAASVGISADASTAEPVWALGPAPLATATPGGRPGPTNTGVPAGTTLRVHEGDLTITTAGTVVDGMDIRGYVRVKAPNVVIKNSIIRGRPGLTSYMSLIQSPYPTNNLLVQDTTLVAANPTPYVDGIVGKGFTLNRVNIYGVIDSVKITGDNVLVENSWLHDNLYYLQDPNYGNTPTHDDNVQIQVGTNITIRNSVLEDTHNAAVMITQDAGKVANFTFSGNWADNGACTINVAQKSYGPVAGLSFTGNTFGLGTRHARCAILMPTTTSSIATVSGNVFTDGSVVTVSRG